MVNIVKDISMLLCKWEMEFVMFDVAHVFTLIFHKECINDIEKPLPDFLEPMVNIVKDISMLIIK